MLNHCLSTYQKIIIKKTVAFVKLETANAEGGHDWFHILRVWNLSKHIAKTEQVDMFIVELGALLHDIADSKFHNGNEEIGPQKARAFLNSLNVEKSVVSHIEQIISNISFKTGLDAQNFKSPELEVIQDADRLDAMGAIGIARAFNYGGYKNREMYNPAIAPVFNITKEEYKQSKAPTLNHFYEKLLLLKDKMNTETGKSIAQKRHNIMVQFLEDFLKEWNGDI